MFAGVWVVLLPLCFSAAWIGVLLWVWVALLSPNDLLTGFMSGVPFNKIVAIATLLVMVLRRDKRSAYFDGTLALLIGLGLVGTVSWLTALVPTDDGTDLYQKLIKEIVLAVVITAVMTTRLRLHLLALTFVLSLGFLGVKEGLISLLTAGGHQIIGSGSIGDNNSLATALLMAIPLMYYLSRYSAVRAVRLGLLAALGLSVVTVVMTFSRGGFVGLVLLGGVLARNSPNKLRTGALVLAAAVLTYLFAPATWFDRLNTIQDAGNDASFIGRVVAWKISLLIALDHPWFGGGMHAVQRLAIWQHYTPYIDSVNFVTTPPPDVIPHAAHSIYFEMLGDMGFTGLALFVALLGRAFLNCRWIFKHSQPHPSLRWAGDLARMVQVSLLMYVVTGAALSMGYFEGIYVLLALVSRCRRTVAESLATLPAPQAQVARPHRLATARA